jgi:hypothetical protein
MKTCRKIFLQFINQSIVDCTWSNKSIITANKLSTNPSIATNSDVKFVSTTQTSILCQILTPVPTGTWEAQRQITNNSHMCEGSLPAIKMLSDRVLKSSRSLLANCHLQQLFSQNFFIWNTSKWFYALLHGLKFAHQMPGKCISEILSKISWDISSFGTCFAEIKSFVV